MCAAVATRKVWVGVIQPGEHKITLLKADVAQGMGLLLIEVTHPKAVASETEPKLCGVHRLSRATLYMEVFAIQLENLEVNQLATRLLGSSVHGPAVLFQIDRRDRHTSLECSLLRSVMLARDLNSFADEELLRQFIEYESSADEVLMAWLTLEREDLSVACFMQESKFHYVLDSPLLKQHVSQLRDNCFSQQYLVRGAWLPGDDPDNNENFTLLAYDKIQEEKYGTANIPEDSVAQYFEISAHHVLLLRSDLCWTCKKRQHALSVCACKVARYCDSSCQLKDWKAHKSMCKTWRPLQRIDLQENRRK